MLACLECWCLVCMACYTYGVWRLFMCLGIKQHDDMENQSSQRPLEELDSAANQDFSKPHQLGHSFQQPGFLEKHRILKPIQVPPSQNNTHLPKPANQLEKQNHSPEPGLQQVQLSHQLHRPEKQKLANKVQSPTSTPQYASQPAPHQPNMHFANEPNRQIESGSLDKYSQRPSDNFNRKYADKPNQPAQLTPRSTDAPDNSNKKDIDKPHFPAQSSQRPLDSLDNSGTKNLEGKRLFERSTPNIFDKQEQIKSFVDPRSPPPVFPQHNPLKPLETAQMETIQQGPNNDPNRQIKKEDMD